MTSQSTETSTQTEATETTTETDKGGDGFQPITSQADLDRILGDRVARERAKFADYSKLKADSKRLVEMENEGKSETQKLTDKIAAVERERDDAKREAMVYRISAAHGITDEDAELFLTGSDEETLTRQAKRLAERRKDDDKKPPVVPGEGTTTTNPGSESRDAVTRLFGGDGG